MAAWNQPLHAYDALDHNEKSACQLMHKLMHCLVISYLEVRKPRVGEIYMRILERRAYNIATCYGENIF